MGGGSREFPIPEFLKSYEHVLLDIDPKVEPDVLCDARELGTLEPSTFDVIYCSHNLEHYYFHDVPKVLAGFRHVLKDDGFAVIRVPDILSVFRTCAQRQLQPDDVLYTTSVGPIRVMDVIYGYGPEIERSGSSFYAHKTGFSPKLLKQMLAESRFSHTYVTSSAEFEIAAFSFLQAPSQAVRQLLSLPGDLN